MLKETIHEPTKMKIWSFKMQDFYEVALDNFISDIYNYLEYPPDVRPYSK